MQNEVIPQDPLGRRLWLLGLSESERERILETARERSIDVLSLAEFCVRMRTRSIEEMQLRVYQARRCEGRIARAQRWIRSILKGARS